MTARRGRDLGNAQTIIQRDRATGPLADIVRVSIIEPDGADRHRTVQGHTGRGIRCGKNIAEGHGSTDGIWNPGSPTRRIVPRTPAVDRPGGNLSVVDS